MRQGGLILAVGRVRSKETISGKRLQDPPHPKIHTTKSTAAQRPRPPRDGARRYTSPRVSPYSPASIDAEFVEIGPVQLSQISNNDERYTHAHTKTRTYRQTSEIMAPCTHPGMERLFFLTTKKRSRFLRSLGLASLLVERYIRQGYLVLAVDRVRSK